MSRLPNPTFPKPPRLDYWPTNAELVMAVLRPGSWSDSAGIAAVTAIPPSQLNGTLGHLCRTGKLERFRLSSGKRPWLYRRPAPVVHIEPDGYTRVESSTGKWLGTAQHGSVYGWFGWAISWPLANGETRASRAVIDDFGTLIAAGSPWGVA